MKTQEELLNEMLNKFNYSPDDAVCSVIYKGQEFLINEDGKTYKKGKISYYLCDHNYSDSVNFINHFRSADFKVKIGEFKKVL